jgi:glycosyltransferase involved in cell wall biosynthesis
MLEPWAWQHKKWKKRPYWYLIERVHLQRAHRVLATSALEANNLAGFVEDVAIKTIPLALTQDVAPDYEEARRTLNWGSDETILLYLSRIHPKKGLHLLLEALATGDANYEDVRMVIVGDGPDSYVNRLRRFADDNQCRLPTIEWEGSVWGDRKWRYMQGADLFCLPTRSENFGLVVLEACQVGTPVLTTTGTPWSILEDWSSGFAVTPDVASLQSAVREYLDHWSWTDGDRNALAEKTRKRFDINVVGAQYLTLYQTILNGGGTLRCDSEGTGG